MLPAAGQEPAAAAPASAVQLLEVPALPPAPRARGLCEELMQEALHAAATGSGAIAWSSGAKEPFSFEELLARDMQLEEGSAQLPLVLLDDDADQVGLLPGEGVLLLLQLLAPLSGSCPAGAR
jgi:hypothetical protein